MGFPGGLWALVGRFGRLAKFVCQDVAAWACLAEQEAQASFVILSGTDCQAIVCIVRDWLAADAGKLGGLHPLAC